MSQRRGNFNQSQLPPTFGGSGSGTAYGSGMGGQQQYEHQQYNQQNAGTANPAGNVYAQPTYTHQQQQPPAQQQPQQQQQVEWYSSGHMTMVNQQTGYSANQYAQPHVPAYNAGAAQYSYSNSVGAGEYGSFDEDGPLLEELGIDVPAIVHRIKAILTFRFAACDADSLDLGGPIIFMSIFAMAHLLVGKLHFGYILGWMVVGSILLWFILSSIAAGANDGDADEGNQLDLYSCCSIVGYSLLPLVIHALLSLLFPRRSMVTFSIAIIAVLWAAGTASKLFILRSRPLRGKNVVVAYPCMLMYTAFALLTLY